METTGQRIVTIRQHRMMTQAELAKAIGESRHIVFHIEHGHTRIDLDQAERIATALHRTIADLRAPLDAEMPHPRPKPPARCCP